ncbi:MAG: hypothetical protein WEA09_08980 [Gemmatimonadota bacterium]
MSLQMNERSLMNGWCASRVMARRPRGASHGSQEKALDDRNALPPEQVAHYLPPGDLPSLPPTMNRFRIRLRTALAAALLVVGAGCSPSPAPTEEAPLPQGQGEVSDPGPGRVYERHFVFMAARPDTSIMLPWSFITRTRPGGVIRQSQGWVVTDGTFDPFVDEAWDTPPSRTPWRLLPTPSIRLVVDLGDALDRMVFREGGRRLDLEFGNLRTEWAGPGGETIRLHDGSLILPALDEPGLLLDLARSRTTEASPAGDWAILISGDSLQVVLEEPQIGEVRSGTPYRGWTRFALQDLTWPQLFVEWSLMRPFERARRDVPVAWTFASSDGRLTGELTALSMQLTAGEGTSPLLPVEGFFYLEGTVTLDGRLFPIQGLLRHQQP